MKRPAIKAVLFDLDDTLWPIVPVIVRAEEILHDWLAAHAPLVPQRFTRAQLREIRDRIISTDPAYQVDLRRLRHATLTEAFLHAGEDIGGVDAAMAVFSSARNAVTPFADVVPGLVSLATRVKVGSISNGAADLEEIGMAQHFHYSIAAHQSGWSKPDARIFLAACDALEVLPAEAVYVGDDPHLDVEGAQKAGLLAVWMKRPELTKSWSLPDHIVPDAVCTSLPELEAWLLPRL